jgi:hypothetical protein
LLLLVVAVVAKTWVVEVAAVAFLLVQHMLSLQVQELLSPLVQEAMVLVQEMLHPKEAATEAILYLVY